MSLFAHRHSSRQIGADHPLSGQDGLHPHHGRRQPGSLCRGVSLAGSAGAAHAAFRRAHARVGRQIHHRRRVLSGQGHGGRFPARHRAARLRPGAHGVLHAHGGRPLPLRPVRAVPAQDSARGGLRPTCRCSLPPARMVTPTWATSPRLFCAWRGGRWSARTPCIARC